MKSYLKTKTFEFRGDTLTLRELSAHSQIELLENRKVDTSGNHAPALLCKFGVVEWENETIEELELNVGSGALLELMLQIRELSGLTLTNAEKKELASATTQTDDSSSDSP